MKFQLKERPRERLYEKGPTALQTQELLALLLRTGSKGENVVELGNKLLTRYSLGELSRMNCEQIQQFRGISYAKATTLVSAFELGRRVMMEEVEEKTYRFSSSQDVLSYAASFFSNLKYERVLCLFVSSKNSLLKAEILHEGGIDYSMLDPRNLMKRVLEIQASGFFLIHNHPSGDPTPSKEDREITLKIQQASDMLGVRFLDHIIFGNSFIYYSFFDEGDL